MPWLSADTSSRSSSSSSVLLAFHQLGITHLFSSPPFFLPLCQSIKHGLKLLLSVKRKCPKKRKETFFGKLWKPPPPHTHTHTHTHQPRNNNNNNNNPKKPTSIIHMYNESKMKLSSCLEDICNFDEIVKRKREMFGMQTNNRIFFCFVFCSDQCSCESPQL